MKEKKSWNQFFIFVILLISLLIIREYITDQFIIKGIDDYSIHSYLGIGINILLIGLSYIFIHKNKLLEIAGIKGTKLRKAGLLIFPLIYLVLLNAIFLDEIGTNHLLLLFIYCISVGFAEEFSIRGCIQSFLLKQFATTKKNIVKAIILASVFFGILHLFKFDKGIYGELSQVVFATFIGIMFGVLLIITKKIYPLVIIHTIIDFVAKLDTAGLPIQKVIRDPASLENAILSVLLVLPCLIYAIFLIKKHPLIN